MGAATHGLKTQRFVATVLIKVAMHAPCTVILVKQTVPFERLVDPSLGSGGKRYANSDSDAGNATDGV